jgi:hypothetical protein
VSQEIVLSVDSVSDGKERVELVLRDFGAGTYAEEQCGDFIIITTRVPLEDQADISRALASVPFGVTKDSEEIYSEAAGMDREELRKALKEMKDRAEESAEKAKSLEGGADDSAVVARISKENGVKQSAPPAGTPGDLQNMAMGAPWPAGPSPDSLPWRPGTSSRTASLPSS